MTWCVSQNYCSYRIKYTKSSIYEYKSTRPNKTSVGFDCTRTKEWTRYTLANTQTDKTHALFLCLAIEHRSTKEHISVQKKKKGAREKSIGNVFYFTIVEFLSCFIHPHCIPLCIHNSFVYDLPSHLAVATSSSFHLQGVLSNFIHFFLTYLLCVFQTNE